MAEQASFLKLLQKRKRGKLKVYIGMAPGVGKTYRMLQEGNALFKQGIDVCIGLIETHNRKDTVAQLGDLPVLNERTSYYKGRLQSELDLQGVLNRRPEVVIIDELAHSNVAGSVNPKRWQDIDQILDAGVSVITAVNIQHLESLAAELTRITGLEISERVPDGFINSADEVVNIDLTVTELVDRLKAGKIYQPERVAAALENFFQEDKLLQLRELALREVTRQVDRQIDVKLPTSNAGIKAAKVMLCISTNHESAKRMIRKMARFITGDHAIWYVVYVQTPDERAEQVVLSKQRHLINNLKLATEMGAKVETIKANSFADAIYNFIKTNEISLCALGKSEMPWFKRIYKLTPTQHLMRLTKDLPVDYLILTSHELKG